MLKYFFVRHSSEYEASGSMPRNFRVDAEYETESNVVPLYVWRQKSLKIAGGMQIIMEKIETIYKFVLQQTIWLRYSVNLEI